MYHVDSSYTIIRMKNSPVELNIMRKLIGRAIFLFNLDINQARHQSVEISFACAGTRMYTYVGTHNHGTYRICYHGNLCIIRDIDQN